MEKRIIYALEKEEINRFVCYIDKHGLKSLYEECKINNSKHLCCFIKLFLQTKNKIHLSYILNDIVNYVPKDKVDCNLHSKIVSNIFVYKQNKNIDFTKYLIRHYHKEKLNKLNYKDDYVSNNISVPVFKL